MNVDIITVQSFLSIAENGSITKAAKKVGRTQSAISQQIFKLENLLGKTLLLRDKNIKLTVE